jgi:glutamate N-acetyltransferase/amino-acid N-acetyltransferase
MAVGLSPPDKLLSVAGIELSASSAGLYNKHRDDVVLIHINGQATVSAVFTRNRFEAAPVSVARKHLLTSNDIKYCLINSGNANAGMGEKGIQATLATCNSLAEKANCESQNILPFSTGVIGEDLPVDKINMRLPVLLESLKEDNWAMCVQAIMTTDTVPKGISRQVELDGGVITITGIAKGSGMIRPDMATMLAFIGTDAVIDKDLQDMLLNEAMQRSFNRICVDGDMSTNDACVLIATGRAAHKRIDEKNDSNYGKFSHALFEVCEFLAQAIVRDGEGASKFVQITIAGGASSNECLNIAYTIAGSPLVKIALFASDPNWGRILAAIGYAEVEDLDIQKINISLNGCRIVSCGVRDEQYTESDGVAAMASEELLLQIELGRGSYTETVWTCDLSHEYVRINAEYRS